MHIPGFHCYYAAHAREKRLSNWSIKRFKARFLVCACASNVLFGLKRIASRQFALHDSCADESGACAVSDPGAPGLARVC